MRFCDLTANVWYPHLTSYNGIELYREFDRTVVKVAASLIANQPQQLNLPDAETNSPLH